jgi:hypothetical protein
MSWSTELAICNFDLVMVDGCLWLSKGEGLGPRANDAGGKQAALVREVSCSEHMVAQIAGLL